MAHGVGHQEPVEGQHILLQRVHEHRGLDRAVGDHRALGEPGGATGVNEDSSIGLGGCGRRRDRWPAGDEGVVADVTGIARVSDDDDVLKARDVGEHRLEIGEVRLFHQDGADLGVRQYPGPLLGVEPVVEQREHQPG